MEREEWKDVKGFEGLYQVSNLGRVKSLERYVPSKPGVYRLKKEQILQPCCDNCDYEHYRLAKNGTYTLIKAHRLVAKHFLDDYTEELTVNHIDHNRHNNNANNLEMMSFKENLADALPTKIQYYIKELDTYTCSPGRVIKKLGLKYSRYRFYKCLRNSLPYANRLTFSTVENENE